MKLTLHKSILLFVTVLVLSFSGTTAAFAGILTVNFESDPLFGEANFLPGDTVSRTVEVINTDDQPHDVYVEMVNVVDGGLGDLMDVTITSGGALFSGTFNQLDAANEQFLSTLPSNTAAVYTFNMTFQPQTTNGQGGSLAFDFCIGFSGGPTNCDATTEGGDGDGDGDGDGGGGGPTITLTRHSNGPSGPEGEILGEQTSIIPVGAPNTGLGGASVPHSNLEILVVLVFMAVFGIRDMLKVHA